VTDHVRQQIRDHVVTLLTGLATTGSNVHGSRVRALKDDDLPALLVYTTSEAVTEMTIGLPRTQVRSLDLVVEGLVGTSGGNPDDTLDDIAKEVETAIAGDVLLGDLAKSSALQATEIDFQPPDAKRRFGAVRLTYEIVYATKESAPTVAV
jgi:hypothetical protein